MRTLTKIIFLLIIIIGLLFESPVIVISCGNHVLYEKPLRGELRVILRYVHSVEKTPVIEVFKVKEDGIFLEKFLWQSFGAGLPLEPINAKARITEVGDFYCMDSIGENLGYEITAWFIPENKCEIHVNGEHVVKLDGGGLLTIRLIHIPLYEAVFKWLFGGVFNCLPSKA